jgi:hypothetical protein
MNWLSKSTYIMGQQCPKRLWLYKKRPELLAEHAQAQGLIFEKGIDVGLFAREIFSGGHDSSPVNHFHYQDAVARTQELIKNGAEVIYEAAFQYDGVLAALDILVNKNNKWYACEVKSSSEVKEHHYEDAAPQFYVTTNAGLPIEDFSIVHINTEYERDGQIDVSTLFKIISLKKEIIALQKEVTNNIARHKNTLTLALEPITDIGSHCHDPYECEFSGHCWSHIPDVSVFNLTRLRFDKKFELYSKGIVEFHQIPNGYQLSASQQLQVKGHLENYTHIEKPQIQKWTKKLRYPLAFMDFETFVPAIPLYNKSRPYQQIPFQFSVHVQNDSKMELQHFEYLGSPESDPRPEFLKQLLTRVSGEGSIVVYNKSFEASRLKELKELFPELSADIDKILMRLIDLMEPFQQKWYYTPSMNGSYSIKQVLPALVPELSYEDLDIGEGGAAMAAFESLLKLTDDTEKSKARNSLLEYCKLDTLAMTRILNVLYTI